MVKKTKLAKSRLDKYYWQAKDQGFRSRAAFKLIQLDRKFAFLESSQRIVDLCAAPGGWLQVCKKLSPVQSKIVGVDLDPIKQIPGVSTFEEDIKSASCKSRLSKAFNGQKVDLVLNDGAPSVGGAWDKDSYLQIELSLYALRLACSLLRPRGTFITKAFRSTDYPALLGACRHFFEKVVATKPHSSRETSAEIYIICTNFDYSKKDPNSEMLDPKFLFKEKTDDKKTPNVLRNNPQKRHRSGYTEDLLRSKVAPAIEFVNCSKPEEFLAKYSKISFDEASLDRLKDVDVDEEIKSLCEDLLVLSKSDFRRLIRWKAKALKKIRPPRDKAAAPAAPAVQEEALVRWQRREKRERRRLHREKMRGLKRMKLNDVGGGEAPPSDDELFSLRGDGGKLPASEEEAGREDSAEDAESMGKDEYLEEQELLFDRMYEEYKEKMKQKRPPQSEGEKELAQTQLGGEKDLFSAGIFKEFAEKMAVLAPRGDEDGETAASIPAELEIDQPYSKKRKEKNKKQSKRREKRLQYQNKVEAEKPQKTRKDFAFEEVEAESSGNSSDSEAIAETLALGKALQSQSRRQKIIDGSFGRHVFSDHGGLPDWFVEDERRSFQRAPPVSAAEVAAFRRDKRSKVEKKAVEAVARKKARRRTQFEKAKAKMNAVVEAKDLSAKQKTIEVENIKKALQRKKKRDVVYRVSKRGRGAKVAAKKVPKGAKFRTVDKRLKADKRKKNFALERSRKRSRKRR